MIQFNNLYTHKLQIAIQERPFDELGNPCPPLILWQGCGTLVTVDKRRSSPFTGSYGGVQEEPNTHEAIIPKDVITANAVRTADFYLNDVDELSIWNGSQFQPHGEVNQVTNDVCDLIIPLRKVDCEPSSVDIKWCIRKDDCRNGVIVTFDPLGAETLINFINRQSKGTTIMLPDGTYDGGPVTVDYVIIEEETAGAVTMNVAFDTSGAQDVVINIQSVNP